MASPQRTQRQPLGFRFLAAALTWVPAPVRGAMGWWQWADILKGDRYSRHLKRRAGAGNADDGPVKALLCRGIPLPADLFPWPDALDDPDQRFWRSVTQWETLDLETVAAWAGVWRTHPKGQSCLDRALVLSLANGWREDSGVLLAAGADPLADPLPEARKNVMVVYWDVSTGRSFDARLEGWQKLVTACPGLAEHGWSRWIVTTGVSIWQTYHLPNEAELVSWRASGLPMPQGEAALKYALLTMRANPAHIPHIPCVPDSLRPTHVVKRSEALQTIRWWKSHGALPVGSDTRLLAAWLSLSILDAPFTEVLDAWAKEFLADDLPPRPQHGPHWGISAGRSPVDDENPLPSVPWSHWALAGAPSVPWSHWALAGAHFTQLPAWALKRLFSEPDAFTARDGHGRTVLDVLERRIEGSTNLESLRFESQIRAWAEARRLQEALPIFSDTTPDGTCARNQAVSAVRRPRRRL